MKLFNRKVCLDSPPRSDIVIFDETNSEFIIDYILQDLTYYIYKVRPGNFFISFKVIYYF